LLKAPKYIVWQALVLLLGLGLSANAQSSLGDSIKISFTKKPKLVFRFDSHGSFITNQPARISALGAGLRFGNYVRVGATLNWLNSNIYRSRIVPSDSTPGNDTVTAKLNYGLFSIYTNIVVARKKKWEFTVPLELGFGSSSYGYTSAKGKKMEIAKGGIITFEPMFMAEYKVFNWLGLGAGLGLRLVPVGNRLMNENFNSLLWDANLSIYFGQIYRNIQGFVKKKQAEKQKNNIN
jgi:hypothetical protein